MTATRKFGTFAVAFAIAYPIVYLIVFQMNWAALTYHSALGQIGLGPAKPINGPAMYWYGWIVTSAVCAGIIAALTSAMPDSVARKLPPVLAWVVPVLAIVTAAGLMINMYFMR